MRTLLLGTDFMYNSNGDLIPIEINTNVGFDRYMVEEIDEIFNVDILSNFITTNGFTKVTYIGGINSFSDKISALCNLLSIEYEFNYIFQGITVPEVNDYPEHLIIRSAYDTTAIVDDVYCKNKINFMNLIKLESFASEFAYLDEEGALINNITVILNNGNHPNFIVKSISPQYDRNEYPKFYKVSNMDELNVVLQTIDSNHYIMPFYFNPNKLYSNHIQVIRSLNLLVPPNLETLQIGQYTKLTTRNIDELSVFDPVTFELKYSERNKYVTSDADMAKPKLLDTDRVEMADGTFKTALELEVGDVIKTVIIPNPYDIDLSNDLGNFHITYEEFETGSTYSTNVITDKIKVDKMVSYVTIYFTDGSNWEDTSNSSYLIVRNNEVMFRYLNNGPEINRLAIGDDVILIDTTTEEFSSITKEVSDITVSKMIFSGWEIVVEQRHIFLTQSETGQSYAAIEHNPACVPTTSCNQQGTCPKGQYCCYGTCTY